MTREKWPIEVDFEKAFRSLPAIVMFVKMAEVTGGMIGKSTYERAIAEYPEHFPEEVEHRRKWALIPQEVHDAYEAEFCAMREELYKDIPPPGSGLVYWMSHQKEMSDWFKERDKLRPEEEKQTATLRNKHYGPFGITFNL